MAANDWQKVEDIFHAALGLGGVERDAYLDGACASDVSLRGEVESLLAAFEGRRGFMEEPVLELGMKVFSGGRAETLAGRTLGPYRLIETLGKGGMGEVYLAEDTRLGRKVALKFISTTLVDDNWAKRQLVREAQAVAMLDHPNICAVHGIEETDGHNFIVMQHVEGRTLDHLMAAGPLEPERVLSLSVQIVSALAEAHAHGIIHRDIKPQNIVVTEGGQVKVLDFGLAKFAQRQQGLLDAGAQPSETTQRGLIIGTVAYMSPEQLKAERLDYRSDVFSFGTVLYEMLGGRNPYAHESSAETISAILTKQPPPLKELADGVARALERIARKCQEKDKELRYPSTSELLYELGEVQAGARPRLRPRRNSLRAAAALLILLIVAVSVFAYLRLTKVQRLAVLPIANASADANVEYLGDGLTESLISKLSKLSKLRVKPGTAVSGYKGREVDPRQIGRELQVDAVLVGRIVRQGESLVLETEMVDAGDGTRLWGERYRLDQHIFEAQERVCERVASSLLLWLGGEEKKALAAHRTDNTVALRHYMEGRFLLGKRDKETVKQAIAHFDEAIRLDRAYAQAYAGLAECYVLLPSVAYGDTPPSEAMPKARAAAKHALEIDDTLAEAHNSLGIVKLWYEWDWQGAQREFELALDLKPDYAPARYAYSNLLAVTGRWDEFIRESAAAKELDPFSTRGDTNFCRAFYYTRQFDKAADCLNRILDEHPNDSSSRYVLGYVYLQQGMDDAATEVFQKMYAANKRLALAPLGFVYGKTGRRAEALKILAEAEQLYEHDHLPAQELAIIHMGLGRKDEAFAWLEKAYAERYGPHIYVPVDPLFDSLRSDARFAELAQRLNLSPPPLPN
ncbi:MAG TPA: protein kinase [Pyrinomonadaceae bacterium]|nr:protein kinase [Pyrinomonadaceae bacterium]